MVITGFSCSQHLQVLLRRHDIFNCFDPHERSIRPLFEDVVFGDHDKLVSKRGGPQRARMQSDSQPDNLAETILKRLPVRTSVVSELDALFEQARANPV